MPIGENELVPQIGDEVNSYTPQCKLEKVGNINQWSNNNLRKVEHFHGVIKFWKSLEVL
jgi:hypothetical protein